MRRWLVLLAAALAVTCAALVPALAGEERTFDAPPLTANVLCERWAPPEPYGCVVLEMMPFSP